MGAVRLPSGAFTSTDQEVAEQLLETHFPGCQPILEPQSQSQTMTASPVDWLIASSVITEEKIIGFGPYKTAGEAGIFPGLLQQGIETLVVPLCKILTACLAFGYVPKAWHKLRVMFIPKPGLSSYELAKSFSLTSFLLKTMERLVNLHDYPLNPMQHAYLKGKSTETALHDLVYKIDGSLAQKEFALRVFLYVEGAFDNTSFESMGDAASDHGVCSTINRWIDFMLSIFVDIRRVKVHMSVRRGCPLACVLSPLLWNMVADSLLNRLENCNCFVQGFADDVVILISWKFLSTICDLM
jgi:hypothetical protein